MSVLAGTSTTDGSITFGANSQNPGNFVNGDNVYTFGDGTGYDLSQGAGTVTADVTYTIFVP